jgi:hypothetical protein
MVPGRDDVRAQVKQVLRNRGRYAEPARGVFPVDDKQVDLVGLHHVVKMFANDASSCRPKYVPNKENVHS